VGRGIRDSGFGIRGKAALQKDSEAAGEDLGGIKALGIKASRYLGWASRRSAASDDVGK
jgi:hypothetical protein